MAAARKVSAEPRMTARPASVCSLAILPTVVVLPVPLMPTNKMSAGASPNPSPPSGEGRRDLLVQQVEHGVGVGQGHARRTIAKVLDDVERRRASDIAQDERFLKTLPEIIVEVRPAVEQDVHRLLELIARTRQTRADLIENPILPPSSCRARIRPRKLREPSQGLYRSADASFTPRNARRPPASG